LLSKHFVLLVVHKYSSLKLLFLAPMNIENYPSSSSERKSDITNRSATLSSSNLPDEDDILNAPDDIVSFWIFIE
jgi:hypothetical protein